MKVQKAIVKLWALIIPTDFEEVVERFDLKYSPVDSTFIESSIKLVFEVEEGEEEKNPFKDKKLIDKILHQIFDTIKQREKQQQGEGELASLFLLEINGQEPCPGAPAHIIPVDVEKFAFAVEPAGIKYLSIFEAAQLEIPQYISAIEWKNGEMRIKEERKSEYGVTTQMFSTDGSLENAEKDIAQQLSELLDQTMKGGDSNE